MSEPQANSTEKSLLQFLDAQAREYGGKVELDENTRVLFALAAQDDDGNRLARGLLAEAPFAYEVGESEDDQWKLYYFGNEHLPQAMHWLADQRALLAGDIRPVSPEHRELIAQLNSSEMPHRIAQKLADDHAAGLLSAGAVNDPTLVRSLLDRLHMQEPLFFSAFLKLLSAYLVDMTVVHQQIINEDIRLGNSIVTSGLSRDPFLQKRQDAAMEIRQILVRFHVISPIDQQKSTIANPYAAYLEIARHGEEITAMVNGNTVRLPRANFLDAIRSIRRNLYGGADFATFSTQVPWVTEDIAYAFRFIKQKLGMHRDLPAIDGLYIIERGVSG